MTVRYALRVELKRSDRDFGNDKDIVARQAAPLR